jgi:hypothetical protein
MANGDFAFIDSLGGRPNHSRLERSHAQDWRGIEPSNYRRQGGTRWDGILHRRSIGAKVFQ